MKHYLDLVKISAKTHRKQSRMTVICIVLAVFLVSVIIGMVDMAIKCQKLQEIKSGGNWHFAVSVSDDNAKLIAARPEVKVSGFYSIVNKNDDIKLNGNNATLLFMDKETLTDIFCQKVLEGAYPQNDSQVALTASAETVLKIKVGDDITVTLPDKSKKICKVTGFIQNSSALLKDDTIGVFFTHQALSLIPGGKDGQMFMVQLNEFCNMRKVMNEVQTSFGLSDKQIMKNGNLLALLFQSDNTYVLSLYAVALVLCLIVLIAAVLMIAGSLNSNVAQRTEFFGMMRCLGASTKQVKRFVKREALSWCKIAVPIGLVCGIIVVICICAMLRYLAPGIFDEMPLFDVSTMGVVIGAVTGVATVLIAASSPARRAAKVSPLTAVSGNADGLKPAKKAASTRFLKVDTALGIHHAKSQRKGFVLMIGSFALSIVLFLSFSVAIDFMNHAVVPVKPYAADIELTPKNGGTIDKKTSLDIKAIEGVSKVYGRMYKVNVPVTINEKKLKVNLVSYESNQFDWAESDVNAGSLQDVRADKNAVALIFATGSGIKNGEKLTGDFGKGSEELEVKAEVAATPFYENDDVPTLVCSEETYTRLTGESNYNCLDMQIKSGADKTVSAAVREIAGSSCNLSNRIETNKEGRGAYYSFAFFVYGFLAVIALISVFNIINSIALSVNSRKKQYGLMRAIGMADKQIGKMIFAETLTYSLSGCVVGCIIGIPLNELFFNTIVTAHWGDNWPFPTASLLLIVAIIIATSVLAVNAPFKRIKNMSIVDNIADQ